jgi:protein translocase SecG subunit
MNNNFILYGQIISMTLVLVLVLMQNRGASLSSSFGGNNEVYITKRGVERTVVLMTWFSFFVYTALTVYSLFLK